MKQATEACEAGTLAQQDIAIIMKVNAHSKFQELVNFVEERYKMFVYMTTGTGGLGKA